MEVFIETSMDRVISKSKSSFITSIHAMFFDHLLKQNDVIVDTKSDLVNLWIPYFHSKNSIYQVKN